MLSSRSEVGTELPKMNQVLDLLESKVIPWATWNAKPRLIVARPQMNAAALPAGVTLSPHPVSGKRVIIRNQRNHANQRLFLAEWPQDNLHEITSPKLSCIVDGAADYLLGKYSVHCGEGNFILIPPRASHHRVGPFLEGSSLQNGSCTLLQTYAYSRDILLWVCRSRGNQHFDEKEDNYLISNGEASQIFHLLIEEAKKGRAGFEAVCHHLLAAYFSLLVRDLKRGQYTQLGPKFNLHPSASTADSFPGRLQNYIEANLNKHITIEDAATHFFMSRSQFCRRIRHENDATFIELLTRFRIENAQRMLRETDWTITLISKLCGLKSTTYFQGLFRRRLGCTPSEYRQNYRAAIKRSGELKI
jgi:AraC-like DNA-binding protein